LRHVLLAIGENFEAEEIDPFLAETTEEEDDEGMIPYMPFCKKLALGPFPEDNK